MVVELTRGERFKDARLEHNQHGKQTMDEVQKATSVSKGLISQMENDECSADFGSNKVTALARHYGVTTDYLLGLSKDPTTEKNKKVAIAVTGLSQEAIDCLSSIEQEKRDFISYLITMDRFRDFIDLLSEYDALGQEVMTYIVALRNGFDDSSPRSVVMLLNAASVGLLDDLKDMRATKLELIETAMEIINHFYKTT